jgi:ankyrin repeat protein
MRRAIFLLSVGVVSAVAQNSSDGFYQAIRDNDLASLRKLAKGPDVNAGDQRGTTPLMLAAAYGSLDALKLLLDGGADVNAKNAFDATALMWCANDMDKVRLLVAKGADVNARSRQGRTPLFLSATYQGGSETVKLLLEKGASVTARDVNQQTPLVAAAAANDTASVRLLLGHESHPSPMDLSRALANAAATGNVEVIRMLLARGADVNAASPPESDGRVKNGPIALGSLTPLIVAVAYSGYETVKTLLDAGAKVNAQDVRGMTPLMLAVASDRPDDRVARILIEKGADLSIKDKDGETALDWVLKFNHPGVLEAFGTRAAQAAPAKALASADQRSPSARAAVEKSLALLQRTSSSFFQEGGCVSCHAQNLTGIAVAAARANGLRVDESAAAADLKTVRLQWTSFEQPLLQRMDPPGSPDTTLYSLLHFASMGAKPDRTVDAILYSVVGQQGTDGGWHAGGVARPPLQDGDFSRTAISIRVLDVYAPAGRKVEFTERIHRAAAWLASANPRTTEDRNMQLLGLKWANAGQTGQAARLRNLLELQRPDGGWSQTPELGSDAYATGQVLYTLREMDVAVDSPAYRRGVEYLLGSQLADGSWHVKSRAPGFQPYFQSGFPYDHDQWISAAGTAWATIALSNAASKEALAAAR